MNKYIITYETETTPITREVNADDPYSACMMIGRATTCKKMRIIKITCVTIDTIWNAS